MWESTSEEVKVATVELASPIHFSKKDNSISDELRKALKSFSEPELLASYSQLPACLHDGKPAQVIVRINNTCVHVYILG